jgi:hypothetical protein
LFFKIIGAHFPTGMSQDSETLLVFDVDGPDGSVDEKTSWLCSSSIGCPVSCALKSESKAEYDD